MTDILLNEARVVDLEIRLAYQEAALQELSDGLVRQQKIIDQLVRQVLTLQEQLRAAGGIAPPSDDVRPPHY
jgi:SlyX protein